MYHRTLVAALLLAAVAPLVHADAAEDEAKCRQWAQEDGVTQEQMANYLSQCLEDLHAAQAEIQEEGGKGKEKKKGGK